MTQTTERDALNELTHALNSFESHVVAYRETLNQEGIWLFLATLGCWGVDDPLLRFAAYGLTVWLFGVRVSQSAKQKGTFKSLMVDIERKIQAAPITSDDQRKAKLWDLAQIQKKQLATLPSILKSKIFLACWLFFSASLIFHVYQAQAMGGVLY
jgi:hypothetical protein